MTLDRTDMTEREIAEVTEGIRLRRSLAFENMRKRYRPSALEPYRSNILALHDAGKSLEDIRYALSAGLLPKGTRTKKNGTTYTVYHPPIDRKKTTIYDFIKKCKAGG